MNLQLTGTITLRSSLAHGGFERGAAVTPFRREAIVQRNPDGSVRMNEYALAVTDKRQREELRQYAQRLLRIIWQSRDRNYSWSYAQFSERVAMAAQMTNSIGDMAHDVLVHMRGDFPQFFNDDAEFFDRVIGAADGETILALLRENGERMLVVTRMQAESLARYEKRELPDRPELLSPSTPASPKSLPAVARVPVYSANAMRNALGRRNAARFILERYGWTVPLDTFRTLFAGGNLTKGSKEGIDIGQRQAVYALMPMYPLFGGCFLPGAMIEGVAKVGKCYPVVREALGVLPSGLREEADALSMRDVVGVEFLARREDANLLTQKYLNAKTGAIDNNSMPVEREVLIPGTLLSTSWGLYQTTPSQVGALVSAFVEFAKHPLLGAVTQMGNGSADIVYNDGENEFLSIVDGKLNLSAAALGYFDGYVAHLDAHKDAIAGLLEASVAGNLDAQTVNLNDIQKAIEDDEQDK